MENFKSAVKKWWEKSKIAYQKEILEEDAQEAMEDDPHNLGINPSTGLPLISNGVDCMGNSFGSSDDWSRRGY